MRKDSSIVHDDARQPVQEHDGWLRFEAGCRTVGFWLLLVILAAGIGGLFSSGIFSSTHATSARQGVTVEYERFGRLTSDMYVKAIARSEPGGGFTLTLGGDLMQRYEIRTLQPQPLRALSQGNTLILEFPAAGGPGEHSVWIGLQPLKPGTSHNAITVNKNETVTFSQFIYP